MADLVALRHPNTIRTAIQATRHAFRAKRTQSPTTTNQAQHRDQRGPGSKSIGPFGALRVSASGGEHRRRHPRSRPTTTWATLVLGVLRQHGHSNASIMSQRARQRGRRVINWQITQISRPFSGLGFAASACAITSSREVVGKYRAGGFAIRTRPWGGRSPRRSTDYVPAGTPCGPLAPIWFGPRSARRLWHRGFASPGNPNHSLSDDPFIDGHNAPAFGCLAENTPAPVAGSSRCDGIQAAPQVKIPRP